jgi:hypothetical protein
LKAVTQALTTEGAVLELIAAHAGTIADSVSRIPYSNGLPCALIQGHRA